MPVAPRKLVLASFLFLLIPASTLRAQQGGIGSIVGELHMSRGDFTGRVFVELQLRTATMTSAYSDDEGKFVFYGLASNPYHVVIRDERFVPVDQTVVLDTSISTTAVAQINLTLREPAKKDPGPKRESGSNPYLIDPAEYQRHFPKKAVQEYEKGLKASNRGDSPEGARHFQKAIDLAPTFYPALNELGRTYLAKSDFKAAQQQFEEVIRLSPNDAVAHVNLGNVFLLTRQFDDAFAQVQEGLRRDPNSAVGQFVLGSVYQKMHKPEESERALREALRLDPKMATVHLELVNLYLSQSKKPEAMNELKDFLKQAPDDARSGHCRDVLHRLENEKVKAH
jgi:Tfp pilus assembly protein PilF